MLQNQQDIYKKVLEVAIKSIIFAVIAGVLTTLTHMLSDMFIFHTHSKPEIANTTLIIYTSVDKMMLSTAYYVLGRKIPIKNTVLRGIAFMWLDILSNYIPQIMGLAFADGEIAEKSFSVSIVVCDIIVYSLLSVILGFLYKNDSTINLKKACSKGSFIKSIGISAIVFPLLVITTDQIMYYVYPAFSSSCVIGVSEQCRVPFLINFYSWFILTGAVLSVFYRMTEYNDNGSFIKFALKYGLLLWTPVVMIMVLFGTAFIPTMMYTVIFLIIIMIVSWINSKILNTYTDK